MARLPNFLVIIRSEKLSGKGQGRGVGVRKKERFVLGKRTFRSQKSKHFVLRIIQTAKVVVNIVKTGYATSAERIRSVHIGNDLLLEAGFKAPDIGVLIGDWGSGGTRGAIEPRLLPSPTDPEQHVATYEALVIPQETAGKCMLTVETDLGTTLYYNAPADAQPLAPGKVRTYNITVKAERLEMETVSSGASSDL